MQLIVTMNRGLQQNAPGKVARYDDEHDPRCFGDNFQGWGASTILIESGGYPDDPEKQFIRKLNFYALLNAFESIIDQSYAKEKIEDYVALPENSYYLYDLVVRNVKVTKDTSSFITNLGIYQYQNETSNFRNIYYEGRIGDIGDMDRHFGYHEYDAGSLVFTPGKVKTLTRKEWDALTAEKELALIKEGYLFVHLSDSKVSGTSVSGHLLNLMSRKDYAYGSARPGADANFILTKNGEPVYAGVNGFWIDLGAPSTIPNTLAF